MQTATDRHYDFALRLKRIEASSQARTQRVFVGEDESYVVPRHEWKVKQSGIVAAIKNALYPISLVMAVVVGVIGHAVTMIARFYVEGLPDWKANPDLEMGKQVVLAYAVATVLGYLVGVRSSTLTVLKLLGVVIGVLCFHNAVHMYPETFAKLTSQLWVSQILAHTKAHSIMWRGISFVL